MNDIRHPRTARFAKAGALVLAALTGALALCLAAHPGEAQRAAASQGEAQQAFVQAAVVESPVIAQGETETLHLLVADEDASLEDAEIILATDAGDETAVAAERVSGNGAVFQAAGLAVGAYHLKRASVTFVGSGEAVAQEFSDGGTCAFTVAAATGRMALADGATATVAASAIDEDGNLVTSDSVAALMSQMGAPGASDATAAADEGVLGAAAVDPDGYRFVVGLDPGHGGTDPGATGYGLRESDLTWKISQYLAERLTTYGNVDVVWSRSEKETVQSLRERVERCVSQGARIFVSVHINAGGGTGAEVWVQNDSSYNYSLSVVMGRETAQDILDRLTDLGLRDRGLKTRNTESGENYPDGSTGDYFGACRWSRMEGIPGFIVEHGFIDNAKDAALLADDNVLRQMGYADADGIASAYGLDTGAWEQSDEGWVYRTTSGSLATGWLYRGGTWYFFSDDGIPATGFKTLGGSCFYFDPNTFAMRSGWVSSADGLHYAASDGQARTSWIVVSGWRHLDGSWYYFDESDGTHPALTGFFRPAGDPRWFHADAEGHLTYGWQQTGGGAWTFANDNGELVSGWQELGGSLFYFDPDQDCHPALTGLFSVGSNRYYGAEDGKVARDREVTVDGVTYQADADGVLSMKADAGWRQEDGTWYHSTGDVADTGWYRDARGWHFLDADGGAQSGWQYLGGSWFYFDPDQAGCPAVTGYFTPAGDPRLFHADGEGRLSVGWFSDGAWHFATAPGGVQSGWQYLGESWYYFDESDGTHPALTGFFRPAGDPRWFHADAEGHLTYGWQQTGAGAWTFANGNGELVSGWQELGGSWYWFQPDVDCHPAILGFFSVDGERYCSYQDGKVYRNAWVQLLEGGLALADDRGALRDVGADKTADGKIRLTDEGGNPRTGWVELAGETFYTDADGIVQTQWQQIDGGWYWLGSQGVKQTGWITPYGTNTYYLDPDDNGRMATGWRQIDGAYYLFDPAGGALQTGWVQPYGSYWYYCGPDGAMYVGWHQINGYWYYFDDPSGVMHEGWLDYNDATYYLEPGSGRMVRGEYWIDGSPYYFSAGGALLSSGGEMSAMAQAYSSATDYLILIDTDSHHVGIFEGYQGNWSLIEYWECGNGAPSTPTVTGSFTTASKGYYFDSGAARCFYFTQFYGNYLFHSVLYYQDSSPQRVMDGRVGVGVSHGCVRLELGNAKWIYDNIPYGTRVISY